MTADNRKGDFDEVSHRMDAEASAASADSPAFLRLPGRDFKTAFFELYRPDHSVLNKKSRREPSGSSTGIKRLNTGLNIIVEAIYHDAFTSSFSLLIFCHMRSVKTRRTALRQLGTFRIKDVCFCVFLPKRRQDGNRSDAARRETAENRTVTCGRPQMTE